MNATQPKTGGFETFAQVEEAVDNMRRHAVLNGQRPVLLQLGPDALVAMRQWWQFTMHLGADVVKLPIEDAGFEIQGIPFRGMKAKGVSLRYASDSGFD